MPVGPGQETGVRASTRRSLDACSKPSPSSGFRFQRAEEPEMKQLDGWWWWQSRLHSLIAWTERCRSQFNSAYSEPSQSNPYGIRDTVQ